MKDNNNKEANSIPAITLAIELLEEYKHDAIGIQRIEIANSIEELHGLSVVLLHADRVQRAINILRNAQKPSFTTSSI